VPELITKFDDLILIPKKFGITFLCPLCGNRTRNDGAGLPPVCTGPHPSLDEHLPEPMVRIS
jgi:hypothetical protein